MGIVVVPTYGSDPATVTAANLDAKVAGLATEFNGSIDNDNIDASAGIVASKLNLATVAQSVTMSAKDFTEAKGADVASATTTTIWVTDGNLIHITGTTTITGFGTAAQAGDERTIVFDGALTLTHNATSLILPGGANITTAAGDTAIVRAETTANARVISYVKASGLAVIGETAATQADQETATSTTTYVSPGRQQFHPSASKGWVVFDGTGANPITKAAGYNINGTITKNGTGDYTISWDTDFSSANYCVFALTNSTTPIGVVNVGTVAAGTVQIKTFDNGGAARDYSYISVVAFGDQ